jgi:hypothetical protein
VKQSLDDLMAEMKRLANKSKEKLKSLFIFIIKLYTVLYLNELLTRFISDEANDRKLGKDRKYERRIQNT